jgi:hypothetical protein
LHFVEFKKSLKKQSLSQFILTENWIVVFWDGDNFCKAFAGAQVYISHITNGKAMSDTTYARVLLQKLCKNCPHPEKPLSNSKSISLNNK